MNIEEIESQTAMPPKPVKWSGRCSRCFTFRTALRYEAESNETCCLWGGCNGIVVLTDKVET